MDDERDACALVAIARKDGAATHDVLSETIRGLECLAHRSGSIDGEGDGSGVLTDIPRELWADASAASVVSLSRSTAVYKLRGHPQQLATYYTDLADPRFRTSMAFGHNRYATNTTTSFERVQPFPTFAHNGEINTIARLRDEAGSLGIALSRDGSDSQDVDATLRGLVLGRGLHPIEALELLFPPIVNEVRRMDPVAQDAFARARASFGPFAQGPAAFLARVGDLCLAGVDAMGLRPLWHVETDEAHVFTSERGFIPLERYAADPRPIAPGEHVALER